jgi:hypothetical protein
LERKRREQAIAKAQDALEKARRIHVKNTEEIAAERSALDRRSNAEEIRWEEEKTRLEAALARARE